MAEAGVVREQVPMFEEFSHEESEYRKHVWKEAQSSTYSAPTEPSFRGWLEGKPNPVLPEDAARYAIESMPSASGTKLSDMFPGAVVGTTYHIKDASAEPRVSVTDRPSTYPDIDKGNVRWTSPVWSSSLAYCFKGSCHWLTSRHLLRLQLTCDLKFRKLTN